jgi:signal transduction histidine kinase
MNDQSALHVADIVSTALKQRKLSGLSEMLERIAEALKAFGCIIWQVAPGASLDPQELRGHMFVLAEWFNGRQGAALHDLPLNDSVTGRAIVAGRTVHIPDIWRDSHVNTKDPFLKQGNIRVMCVVPVTFPDGARGALNVYRNETFPQPFTPDEIIEMELLSALVPDLYQTIRHEVSLDLIGRINELLHGGELGVSGEPLPTEEIRGVLQEVARCVSASFQCLETSIFLADELASPEQYDLVATTLPQAFKKFSNRRDEPGLTSWVLKQARPVKVFDLIHFERDIETIRQEYPEITWTDSLDIIKTAHRELHMAEGDNLPPLSFMAVPVMKGDTVYGIIRCSITKDGPYYFAERELSLLSLVAAQISRFWSGWLSLRQMRQENRAWRAVVRSVGKLNNFVHKELAQPAPEEGRIFAEALKLTSSIIEEAEIMDVRLLDEGMNLRFVQTRGEAWDEGTEEERRRRRAQAFPVNDRSRPSAGARVYRTRRTYVVKDPSDPHYSETFPDTRRLIVAPISIRDKFFGVLDIRATGDHDFPQHAEAISTLLGRQLGLYRHLATTIRELRKTKTELDENVKALELLQKQQSRTFKDLAHQFKTPIIQAHAATQLALSDRALDDRLQRRLRAIRGLCAKAKRVSFNTPLFLSLARGEPLQIKDPLDEHSKVPFIKAEDLVGLLIEAAEDNRLINTRGNVDFFVEKQSFEKGDNKWPRMREFAADKDLLEQAMTDILDNAGKYSYANTVVRISGGRTGTGGLYISVSNKGIPISQNEVRLCRERGWQSQKAKDVSGTGSGIGLWIVDHIMRAHGGELHVTPTTPDHVTDVRLIFPNARVR